MLSLRKAVDEDQAAGAHPDGGRLASQSLRRVGPRQQRQHRARVQAQEGEPTLEGARVDLDVLTEVREDEATVGAVGGRQAVLGTLSIELAIGVIALVIGVIALVIDVMKIAIAIAELVIGVMELTIGVMEPAIGVLDHLRIERRVTVGQVRVRE